MTARLRWLLLLPLLSAGCSSLLGDKLATTSNKPKKEPEKAATPETASPAAAPRINPSTHIAAGQMLERQGDFAGALEQYEKAVTTDPRLVAGYNRLGIVYQKLGRFADADQIYRQGLSASPGSAVLHNNLGYNYLMQKKFDEAEKSFHDSLLLAPGFKRARMNLAITLANQNRFPESVNEFSKVVPADVANLNVAAICLQKGDYAQCEKSLRQALSINPDCPGARDQLQKVARLAANNPPVKSTAPGKPPIPPAIPLAGNASQEPGGTP